MSVQWYCNVAGKVIGPFSPKQLKELADGGRLTPEHLVRKGEEGQWVEARQVKGLFPEGGAAPTAKKQAPKTPVAKPLPSADAAPAPPTKKKSTPKKKGPARAKPVAAPVTPPASGGVGIVTEDGGGQPRPGGLPMRRKSNPLPMVITLGVILVAVIVGGVIFMNSQSGDDPSDILAGGDAIPDPTANAGATTDPAAGDTDDPTAPTPGTVAPASPTAADAEFAEIAKAIKIDDIQVAVRHVSLAPIPFKSKPRSFDNPEDPYLMVEIELSNLNENVLKTYRGWNNMRPSLVIKDEHGNAYRTTSTGSDAVVGKVRSSTDIRADRPPVRDLLIFNEPLPAAKSFFLELPASAFGSQGRAKFKISRGDIKSKPSVKPEPADRPEDSDSDPGDDEPSRPDNGSDSGVEDSIDEIMGGSPSSGNNPLDRMPEVPYPGQPSGNPEVQPSDEPNPFNPGGTGGTPDPEEPFVPVRPDEQPVNPGFHDDGSGIEGSIEELNQSLEGDGSDAEPL